MAKPSNQNTLKLDIELQARLADKVTREFDRVKSQLQKKANLELTLRANTNNFFKSLNSEVKSFNKNNKIVIDVLANTKNLNSQIKAATKNQTVKVDVIPYISKTSKNIIKNSFQEQKIQITPIITKASVKRALDYSIAKDQNIKINPIIAKNAISNISSSISQAISSAINQGIRSANTNIKIGSQSYTPQKQQGAGVSRPLEERSKVQTDLLNKQILSVNGKFDKLGIATDSLINKLQGANKEFKSVPKQQEISKIITNNIPRQIVSGQPGTVPGPTPKSDGRLLTVDKIEKQAQSSIGLRSSLKSRISDLSGVEGQEQLISALTTRYNKLTKSIYGADDVTKSFADRVGEVSGRLTVWLSSATLLYGTLNQLQNTVKTLISIENEFVEIRQAISLTNEQVSSLQSTGIAIARTFGSSISEVNKSFAIFAQQGRNVSEIIELTRVSALGANVTLLKTNEVTELLTATINQFKIDASESISIIDKISNVAANSAVTSKVLADAIRRTGASASEAGVNLDQLNGIVAAIGSATRQAGGEIGTALRFVFQRIQTKPAVDALKELGIATKNNDGTFKSAYSILEDLAKIYPTLSDAQQLNSARAIAGTRHFNSLSIAIRNWDQVQKATLDSQYSQGTALDKNEIAVDTLEKSIIRFTNSIQTLYTNLADNQSLKSFINLATQAVDILNSSTTGGSGLLTGFAALAVGRAATSVISPELKDIDSKSYGKQLLNSFTPLSKIAQTEGSKVGNIFKDKFTTAIGGIGLSVRTIFTGLAGAILNPFTIGLAAVTGIEYLLNTEARTIKEINENYQDSIDKLGKQDSKLKQIQGSLKQIDFFSEKNIGSNFDSAIKGLKSLPSDGIRFNTDDLRSKLETADRFQLTGIENQINSVDKALQQISESDYTSNLITGFDQFGNAIFKSNISLKETEERLKAIAEFNIIQKSDEIDKSIKLNIENLNKANNEIAKVLAQRESSISQIRPTDKTNFQDSTVLQSAKDKTSDAELLRAANIAGIKNAPTGEQFVKLIDKALSGATITVDESKLLSVIEQSTNPEATRTNKLTAAFGVGALTAGPFGVIAANLFKILSDGTPILEDVKNKEQQLSDARNKGQDSIEKIVSTIDTIAKLNPAAAIRKLNSTIEGSSLTVLESLQKDFQRQVQKTQGPIELPIARTFGSVQRAAGASNIEIGQSLSRTNIQEQAPKILERFKKSNATLEEIPVDLINTVVKSVEDNYKNLSFSPGSPLYEQIKKTFEEQGADFDASIIEKGLSKIYDTIGATIQFANEQGKILISGLSSGGGKLSGINLTTAGKQQAISNITNLSEIDPEEAKRVLQNSIDQINKDISNESNKLKLDIDIEDPEKLKAKIEEILKVAEKIIASKSLNLNLQAPGTALQAQGAIGGTFGLLGQSASQINQSVDLAKATATKGQKDELEKLKVGDIKIGETALEKFSTILDSTSNRLKILSNRIDLVGASSSDVSKIINTSFNNLEGLFDNIDVGIVNQADAIINYIQQTKTDDLALKGILNAAEVALNVSGETSKDSSGEKRKRIAALDVSEAETAYQQIEKILVKDEQFLNAFSNIIDFDKKGIKKENIENFIKSENAAILAAAQGLDVDSYIQRLKSGSATFIQFQTQFFDQVQENIRRNTETGRRIAARFAQGKGSQDLSQFPTLSKRVGNVSDSGTGTALPFANITGDVLSQNVRTEDSLAKFDESNKKIQAQLYQTINDYAKNISQIYQTLQDIATSSGKAITSFQKQAADRGENVLNIYKKTLQFEDELINKIDEQIKLAIKNKKIRKEEAEIVKKNILTSFSKEAKGTNVSIRQTAAESLDDFKANKFISEFNAANNAADKLKENLKGLSIASGGLETGPITKLRKDLTDLEQLGVIEELNDQVGRLQTRILFFGSTLDDSTNFAKEFRNSLERIVDLAAKASNFDISNINIDTQLQISKYKSDLDTIEAKVHSIKVISDAIDEASKDQIKRNLSGGFTLKAFKFDGKSIGSELINSIGGSLRESRIKKSLEDAFGSLKNIFKFNPAEADLSNEEKLVQKLNELQKTGAINAGKELILASEKAAEILSSPFENIPFANRGLTILNNDKYVEPKFPDKDKPFSQQGKTIIDQDLPAPIEYLKQGSGDVSSRIVKNDDNEDLKGSGGGLAYLTIQALGNLSLKKIAKPIDELNNNISQLNKQQKDRIISDAQKFGLNSSGQSEKSGNFLIRRLGDLAAAKRDLNNYGEEITKGNPTAKFDNYIAELNNKSKLDESSSSDLLSSFIDIVKNIPSSIVDILPNLSSNNENYKDSEPQAKLLIDYLESRLGDVTSSTVLTNKNIPNQNGTEISSNQKELSKSISKNIESQYTLSDVFIRFITSSEQLQKIRGGQIEINDDEINSIFSKNGQILNNLSEKLSNSTIDSEERINAINLLNNPTNTDSSNIDYDKISQIFNEIDATDEEKGAFSELIKLNKIQKEQKSEFSLLSKRIQEGNRSSYRFFEDKFGGAALGGTSGISSILGVIQGGTQGLGQGLSGLSPEQLGAIINRSQERKFRTVDTDTFKNILSSNRDQSIEAKGSVEFNGSKNIFEGSIQTTAKGDLIIPSKQGNLKFLNEQDFAQSKISNQLSSGNTLSLPDEQGKVFELDKQNNKVAQIDISKSAKEAGDELVKNGTKLGSSAGEQIADAMTNVSISIGNTIGGLMREAIINTFVKSDFQEVQRGAEIGLNLGKSGGAEIGTTAASSLLGAEFGPAGGIVGSVAGEFVGGIAGKAIGELFVSDTQKELNNFLKERAGLEAEVNLRLAQLSITTSGVNFVLGHFKDIMIEALNDIGSALGSLGQISKITKRDTFGFIDQGLGLNIDELIPKNIGNFGGAGNAAYSKANDIDQSNSNIALGSLAAGTAGGAVLGGLVAGASAGAIAGPIGIAVGALIGSIGGGIVALLSQSDSDPVIDAMAKNADRLFREVTGNLQDPFADFKKQIIGTSNSLDNMLIAMQKGTSELEVFSNISGNLSSKLNKLGESVSVSGRGINIGNIRETLNTTLTGIKKQQNAILNNAESEIGARSQIINREADIIRRRLNELRGDDDTGTEEFTNLTARLASLTGELLSLETIRSEALKEAAELSIEMDKALSDAADTILDATRKIDSMRESSLDLANAITYVTQVLQDGTAIDAKSIFSGSLNISEINSLLSGFFSSFKDVPGATGIGGGSFNLNKNDVLELLKSSGPGILQASGPKAKTGAGQLIALSAEELQGLYSFDEQLASDLAGQTLIEILQTLEQAQLKEAERFSNQFDFVINKLVDVAVIGFDSLVLTSKEYLENMSNDIKRWSDETQSVFQNIESAINKYSITATDITRSTYLQQLDLIQSSNPVEFFNAFAESGKETFNILRANARGQLEITDQAKEFYGTQTQLLNDRRNALDTSLQAISLGLESTISDFGINISDLDISGALDTSTLQTIFDRINTARSSTNDNKTIDKLLGLQTLVVNANGQLVSIESELLSTSNELLDTSKRSNELLNKIREDFKNQFEAPKRQAEFIRANLLYLRNLSNAIDTQTGGALLNETGNVNKISEAEFASLKAIDASQQIATTFEQFDELFGQKILEGPKEITTFTKERPITNNISIEINNDFLDASQLTNDASRRLALKVKDQLLKEGFNFRNNGGLN